MILGLFLGFQTMSVSEAGLLHRASKAEVEINWKKQMQLSEGAVSENVKNIVNEFLGDYSEAGGVKIDKALSTFLQSKKMGRAQRKYITNILLDGKLIGENNQVVQASSVILQAMPADDDGDDEKIVKKKKKKNKKAKKTAKKNKKKLKKQNKNKGKKSKKFQEEEVEEVLDEENEELNGVPAPDDEDDYEEEE